MRWQHLVRGSLVSWLSPWPPEPESLGSAVLTLWSWKSHLYAQCLSFLICKLRLKAPTSSGGGRFPCISLCETHGTVPGMHISVITTVYSNANPFFFWLEFNADFKTMAWESCRLQKENWSFPLRRLVLNSAWPVSLIGDRFALRSLHRSFISSSLPACPLCTAFVINVEQLKSLTWAKARPALLWAYIYYFPRFCSWAGGWQSEVRGRCPSRWPAWKVCLLSPHWCS